MFDDALASAPISPLANRLYVASKAIAAHIDIDPDQPRRAFTVVAVNPDLAQGFMSVHRKWIERVAHEDLRATKVDAHPTNHFRARIIGAAVMGMVDAVTRQWILSPPQVKFTDLYEQGFAILAPLLEEQFE